MTFSLCYLEFEIISEITTKDHRIANFGELKRSILKEERSVRKAGFSNYLFTWVRIGSRSKGLFEGQLVGRVRNQVSGAVSRGSLRRKKQRLRT